MRTNTNKEGRHSRRSSQQKEPCRNSNKKQEINKESKKIKETLIKEDYYLKRNILNHEL
jgi:hypothetical protein